MADVLVYNSSVTQVFRQKRNEVWTSKLIGYYLTRSATLYNIRVHKTIDGGATWTLLATLAIGATGTFESFSIWFDQWTPGDTGTRIHIAWQGSTSAGTTYDGLWYGYFDTATDTGTIAAVRMDSTTVDNAPNMNHIGITKAKGGYLYAALSSNIVTGSVLLFYRSIDAGVTWTARTTFLEEAYPYDDMFVLVPGNEADTNDIYAGYLDVSADALSLKVYDDSANTWAETSIDAVGFTVAGSGETGTMLSAAVRHSDGHMILIACTYINNAAGDLRVYDINGSGSIVAKTDVQTNHLIQGIALTIDQNTDDLYVAYGDSTNGATLVDIYYKKSSDGGVTWGSAVQFNVTAGPWRDVGSALSIGSSEGRFMPIFYNGVSFDTYTNEDNALDLLVAAPAYGFLVDWNNDGDFTDTYDDISADVKEVSWNRGRDEEQERVVTGTLEVRLWDPTGKYSPENGASVLSPYVLPGRKVQFSVLYLGTTYYQFTGYIEKFVPDPDAKECFLFCTDGMDKLARYEVEVPAGAAGPYEAVLIGADPGPLETILDAAGWAVADRTLDAGVDTLSVWWSHRTKALDAIIALMEEEASLFYIDELGNAVYEDRHHRLLGAHQAALATFTDTMQNMQYEFSARGIRNEAFVGGHRRVAAASDYVWGTGDRPKVGIGETITVWADLANPCSSFTETESTVDWRANTQSDSGGTYKTSQVAIVSTFYGQSVKMAITNSSGSTVYMVPGTHGAAAGLTLEIRATEYSDEPMVGTSLDSTSQTAYGKRSVGIDSPHQGDANVLQSYAEWLVSRHKDPQPDAVRMSLIGSSQALLTQILSRKISDRITVTCTKLGISAQDYFIERMEHRLDNGGKRHRATFTLSRADEQVYWILGVAGYSELGITTRVAY